MHHLSPDVLYRGSDSELLLLLSPPAGFRVWLGSSQSRSLSTPPFAPSILPQGTGGIFRAPPPALTTAAQKKKKKNLSPLETLLHPNEAILWGFVMVSRPPFPLRENLFILCESSFPSFTRTFIFFRWNTAQVFLSLVSFHIPQISFKRRVASFLLSWKTRVLLRFMWTLIWMRSDTCWLVEINQPLISIPGHYNIWRCCLAYWGSIGLLRSYETALRGKDMSFMLLLVTDQQAAASSSHSNIWHIFFQQFKRTLWRKSEIDCDIGVVLDLNFSVSFDSDFVQLTEN